MSLIPTQPESGTANQDPFFEVKSGFWSTLIEGTIGKDTLEKIYKEIRNVTNATIETFNNATTSAKSYLAGTVGNYSPLLEKSIHLIGKDQIDRSEIEKKSKALDGLLEAALKQKNEISKKKAILSECKSDLVEERQKFNQLSLNIENLERERQGIEKYVKQSTTGLFSQYLGADKDITVENYRQLLDDEISLKKKDLDSQKESTLTVKNDSIKKAQQDLEKEIKKWTQIKSEIKQLKKDLKGTEFEHASKLRKIRKIKRATEGLILQQQTTPSQIEKNGKYELKGANDRNLSANQVALIEKKVNLFSEELQKVNELARNQHINPSAINSILENLKENLVNFKKTDVQTLSKRGANSFLDDLEIASSELLKVEELILDTPRITVQKFTNLYHALSNCKKNEKLLVDKNLDRLNIAQRNTIGHALLGVSEESQLSLRLILDSLLTYKADPALYSSINPDDSQNLTTVIREIINVLKTNSWAQDVLENSKSLSDKLSELESFVHQIESTENRDQIQQVIFFCPRLTADPRDAEFQKHFLMTYHFMPILEELNSHLKRNERDLFVPKNVPIANNSDSKNLQNSETLFAGFNALFSNGSTYQQRELLLMAHDWLDDAKIHNNDFTNEYVKNQIDELILKAKSSESPSLQKLGAELEEKIDSKMDEIEDVSIKNVYLTNSEDLYIEASPILEENAPLDDDLRQVFDQIASGSFKETRKELVKKFSYSLADKSIQVYSEFIPLDFGLKENNLANHFNHITDMVKIQVLAYKEPEKRARIIEFFLDVQKQLISPKISQSDQPVDCLASMAILGGLNGTEITRLNKTWPLVSKEHMKIMNENGNLFDPSKNYQAIRTRISQEKYCIPSPVIFHDFTVGNDEVPSKTAEGALNESKIQKLGMIVENFIKFQKFLTSNPNQPKYNLDGMFKKTPEKDFLYSLSLELEPRSSSQRPSTEIQ